MWVVVLLILMVPTSAFSQSNQMDCAPLDPRISISKVTEAKVKASVGTVYKIAQAGGQVERRAKEEIQNLPTGTTGREQLEARWIYLFCEMLRTSKDMSQAQKSKAFDAVIRATKQTIPQTPSPQSKEQEKAVPRDSNISVVGALPLHLWDTKTGPESVKFTQRRLGIIVKLRNNTNSSPRINVAVIEGCVNLDLIAAKNILIEGEKVPDPLIMDDNYAQLQRSTIQRIRVSGLIRQDSRDVPSLSMAYVGILFPLPAGQSGAIILEPKSASINGNCDIIKKANTQPGIGQLLEMGPNRTMRDLVPEFRNGRLKIRLHVGSEVIEINSKILGELKSVPWKSWSSLALAQMYEVPESDYPPTAE